MRNIHPETAQRALDNAIDDLHILCGNDVGPSDVSWQDIAGTAAANLRCVATYLEQRRNGTLPATMLYLDI